MEFSLKTLECPGLVGAGLEVLSWRCRAGGMPSCGTIRRSADGGEGVDLDKGLLLCIEDIEDEGVM